MVHAAAGYSQQGLSQIGWELMNFQTVDFTIHRSTTYFKNFSLSRSLWVGIN